MAIITYPLNGIEYNAENAETYLCTRTSGVYSSDNHFKATVTGTREVTISKGLAWIQNTDHSGKSVYNDSPVKISIPVADGALPRIDRIVLRFDKAANASTIVLKQGTAKTSPQAPDVSRTEILYELGLCTVSVPASSVSINVGDVTSTLLDESVCGLMRDGVTGLPSQQMFDQFTQKTNDSINSANSNFESAKSKFETESSTLLQNKESAFDSSISEFESEAESLLTSKGSDADSLLQTKGQALDKAKTDFETESSKMLEQAASDLANSKNSYNTWFEDLQSSLGESAAMLGAVPLTRKVNGLQLDKDIALNAGDMGAVPLTRTVNGLPLSQDIDVPISVDCDATIPHTGWSLDSSGFQTVEVACVGLFDTDHPIIDVALTGSKDADEAILNDWALVSMIKVDIDKFKVYATEVPSGDIPIHIKVVY